MEVANDGSIWAGGYSINSMLTMNGFQTDAPGDRDGILIRFSNDLSNTESSTFFGGQFDEEINTITTDNSGNVYITGNTFSSGDFPILNGFQNSYVGGQEGFVAKLDANTNILWSSFIAGTQNEIGLGITVDANENVYVSGTTSSIDFPFHRTVQESYNTLNCENDGFVIKYNNDGTRDWASYYGGWRSESPFGIAVNSLGQVIVAGRTESTDLPVTDDAYLSAAPVNGQNAFLAIFEVTCPASPVFIHSTENAIYYDQFWCGAYDREFVNNFSEDSCRLQLIAPPGYNNYSWQRNGTTVSGANDQFYGIPDPGSSGTDYNLIVEDGYGCATSNISATREAKRIRPMCGFGGSFDENELPHFAKILEGTQNEFVCPSGTVSSTLTTEGFCGASFQWQKNLVDIPGETNDSYTATEPGCYRVGILNTFTGCTVYSISKQIIPIDSVFLNDYNANGTMACMPMDSVSGCASVRIRARIPTCSGCNQSPSGLTYTFYLDGVQVAQNTYGWHSTSIPGNYHVEVSNGTCSIISNTINAGIRPTEPPQWILPTTNRICIKDLDSITLAITHPAANDSATIRFDLPYPMADVTSLDSMITVGELNSGCLRVRLTTKEGCTSNSEYIEFHDTLTPIIEARGPLCIPVRLDAEFTNSCELDSMFWYLGDSLIQSSNYDRRLTANIEGTYSLRIKNGCGDFYSDSVFVSGNLETPTISPDGPICAPATLTLSLGTPQPNLKVNWYVKTSSSSSCQASNANLIPNENGIDIIANTPGYYFATIEDTITGCKSVCSNLVEIQRSVAGASISPAGNIYFCSGTTISNVSLNVSPTSPSFSYQWYRNNDSIPGETGSNYSTSNPGVYRVFLENSCDNAFTPVVTISNIDSPTLSIDSPDTLYLCGLDSTRLRTISDQPLLYQWYQDGVPLTDKIDSIYFVSSPGVYEVYGLNNSTQCEDWSQKITVLNSIPITAIIDETPSCLGPSTGSITVHLSGGIPLSGGNYIYNWSSGQNTATINNLSVGLYSLSVADATGCVYTFDASITAGFSIDASVDSINCYNSQDGKIEINTIGGNQPFLFDWSTGASTPDIDNLNQGSFTLRITDSLGCILDTLFNLNEPSLLEMQLSATHVLCKNENNGLIAGTFSGGTGDYIYSWSSLVTLDTATLAPGTYTLTLTDQNSCELIDSIIITEPDSLLTSINIITGLDCPGDADGSIEVISTGGTAPYFYLWEDSTATNLRTNLGTGIYTVTITDNNSCQSTETAQLTAPNELTFSYSITDVSCHNFSDGKISFTANNGTAPYQYILNGTSSPDSNFTNLAAGNYSLQVIDANNCSTVINDTLISQPDLLQSTLTATNISCIGLSDGMITALFNGGTTPYIETWTNSITTAAADLGPGNYVLTLTDTQGCQLLDSILITEPDSLLSNINISNNLDCSGDTDGALEVITTGGTGAYSLLWADSSTTSNRNNLGTGNYAVSVNDDNGCQTIASAQLISPNELTFSYSIRDVSCNNLADAEIIFTANNGTAPYQYLLNGTSYPDSNFINLSAGNYSLQVNDANNCNTTIIDTVIKEPDLLQSSLTATDVSCFGLSDGMITASFNGGTTPYVEDWATPISTDTANLDPGNYVLTLTDAQGCQLLDSILITEPEQLNASITMVDSLLCNGDQNGIINSIATGGTAPYTFLWQDESTDPQLENIGVGEYTVTIIDFNECADSSSWTLTESSVFTYEIDSTSINCFDGNNGSITISANGGVTPYQISFNSSMSTSYQYENLTAGEYNIQVFDANGCSSLARTITLDNPEELTATSNIFAVECPNTPTGRAEILVTGGTGEFDFLWNTFAGTDVGDQLAAGNYEINIQDQNDCELNLTIEIPNLEAISTQYETMDNLCFGETNGLVTNLSSTGGTTPYSYFLDNSAADINSNIFQGLSAGIYNLKTIDDHGCESIQEISINEPEEMTAFLGQDFEVTFGEDDERLQLNIFNPGPNITTAWHPSEFLSCDSVNAQYCLTPQIVNQQTDMTFEVLVTDENGCTTSDEINVELRKIPVPVYLGNAFSPNADGQNDIFYVQGHASVSSIDRFQIFNRWGALIHSKVDFLPNDESNGWDGYFNGKESATGVYIYFVEFSTKDGKSRTIKGDVLLVK